jgi:hypothetical protein
LRAWVKKERESVVDTKILDIQLVSMFLVANEAKDLGLVGNGAMKFNNYIITYDSGCDKLRNSNNNLRAYFSESDSTVNCKRRPIS